MTSVPRRRPEAEQADIDRRDRRQFIIVGIVFAALLALLTGFYVITNDLTSPPTPAQGALQQQAQPAFDVPDGGHDPKNSGDRGGSQQIGLMIGLGVAIAGGSAYVVHTSRRARRHQHDHAT